MALQTDTTSSLNTANRVAARLTGLRATGNPGRDRTDAAALGQLVRAIVLELSAVRRVASSLSTGRVVTASSNVAVQFTATPTKCHEVVIEALNDNTGACVVGDANIDASTASHRGIARNANDVIVLRNVDLSDLYVNSTTVGDGITYLAMVM